MTELPDIHATDPDQWFEDVQRQAESLRQKIRQALDDTETLQQLLEVLTPHLKPYIVDADDPVHGEQILAEIKYGEALYLGVKNGDWMPLTHRDEGYWWFEGSEPRDGGGEVGELHDYIARRVVTATTWGDEELARKRAREQKEHRRIGESYLDELGEAIDSEQTTAGELREAFHRLINDCLDDEAQVVVADVSPDDHHTHLQLHRDGELFAHILGVDVKESCFVDRISDHFDLDDDDLDRVVVATDHRHFRWPMWEDGPRPVSLVLPDEKDDDVAQYHAAIDWMIRNLRRGLRGPEDE